MESKRLPILHLYPSVRIEGVHCTLTKWEVEEP